MKNAKVIICIILLLFSFCAAFAGDGIYLSGQAGYSGGDSDLSGSLRYGTGLAAEYESVRLKFDYLLGRPFADYYLGLFFPDLELKQTTYLLNLNYLLRWKRKPPYEKTGLFVGIGGGYAWDEIYLNFNEFNDELGKTETTDYFESILASGVIGISHQRVEVSLNYIQFLRDVNIDYIVNLNLAFRLYK